MRVDLYVKVAPRRHWAGTGEVILGRDETQERVQSQPLAAEGNSESTSPRHPSPRGRKVEGCYNPDCPWLRHQLWHLQLALGQMPAGCHSSLWKVEVSADGNGWSTAAPMMRASKGPCGKEEKEQG